MHAKSAVAFAVLAMTASVIALPVAEQGQELAARDVESFEVDARDVDFDLDARDFEDFDLDARDFDFDEFDARELDFDEFDAREFDLEDVDARDLYDFDLEERDWFDEELVERAPQATTAAPSSTSTAAPAVQTVVYKDAKTTIIVTTNKAVCSTRNPFKRMSLALRRKRSRSKARRERKKLIDLGRKNRKAARKAKKAKKNAKATATSSSSPSATASGTAPTLTEFVLPTGATFKDGKTEKKDGSTTIFRTVSPKPTSCSKSKKSKRSYEAMDELD
jgi:hypothetical protein